MSGRELAVKGVSDVAKPDHEYRSRLTIAGVPLVHIVRGVDPSTGKLRPAVGVVAVGQVAVGGLAIGQLSVGGIAIGQASFGLLGGIGQLATGLVALGQLAFGAVGAAGQVAVAPTALGLIPLGGPWTGILWLITGGLLGSLMLRRLRRLGPLFSRKGPVAVSALREGAARIAGHVVSDNALRAPLSNEPCAHWQARRLGPGSDATERAGTTLLVSDGTGTARVELDGAVMLIEPRTYGEPQALDWSLQVESYLANGDRVTVAGPVHLEPDPEGSPGLYREAPVRAVFRGDGVTPVLVTTQGIDRLRAQHRLSVGIAAAFALAGAAALAPATLAAAAGAAAIGTWLAVRALGDAG